MNADVFLRSVSSVLIRGQILLLRSRRCRRSRAITALTQSRAAQNRGPRRARCWLSGVEIRRATTRHPERAVATGSEGPKSCSLPHPTPPGLFSISVEKKALPQILELSLPRPTFLQSLPPPHLPAPRSVAASGPGWDAARKQHQSPRVPARWPALAPVR
jgi:hypothetical protein